MIFQTPELDPDTRARLAELDDLHGQLREQSRASGRWLAGLRRRWRAACAESSIEVAGFHVPEDETIALASGDEPADPGDEDRMALSCYARAMDHVGVMSADRAFGWDARVVLDLHFDACYFHKDRDPGQYRRRGIELAGADGGPPAHVGPPVYVAPPADDVPALMGEIIEWLDRGDLHAHLIVRAAMAHLHLVSVHPFRDGNGRIARILQSLVLARGGLSAPEFVAIEEYLAGNTAAYYATLQTVQGDTYRPERDATAWVRFCIGAHLVQARLRLHQLDDAARRWALLEALVEQRGWPDRLVIALEQSLFQGIDRATYATEADVSAPTASSDLRRLVDAGLIIQKGKGRATRYAAGDGLRGDVSLHPNPRRSGPDEHIRA
jgi:hypothetical protein